MSSARASVAAMSTLLAGVVALVIVGCEKSDDLPTVPSSPPTPYSTTKRTPMTLPTTKSVADLALQMLIPMPSSMPTSMPSLDEPTTRPATTRADPTAQPTTAVEYMFQNIKDQNFGEVRDLLFEPMTTMALRQSFANAVNGFKRGTVVSVIDSKEMGNAAFVIVRSQGRRRADNDLSFFFLIRRYDRWKILLDEPNPKKLSPLEKADLVNVADWGHDRMKQLAAIPLVPATTTTTRSATSAPVAH